MLLIVIHVCVHVNAALGTDRQFAECLTLIRYCCCCGKGQVCLMSGSEGGRNGAPYLLWLYFGLIGELFGWVLVFFMVLIGFFIICNCFYL